MRIDYENSYCSSFEKGTVCVQKTFFLRGLLTVRPHGIVILIQAVPYGGSASSKIR